MDRRGFVKVMGMTGFAMMVSPYIPRDPGWDLIPSVEAALAENGVSYAGGSWVVVIHPDLYAEIEDLYGYAILQ